MFNTLKPGMSIEKRFRTDSTHSAKHLGSGDVDVLSTPSMISFMEETCRIMADGGLQGDLTTVGVHVDVKHLRPAPIGEEVVVMAKLLSVDGRRLTFWVEAWWGEKKIGQGIHERHVVSKEEFLRKLKEAVMK